MILNKPPNRNAKLDANENVAKHILIGWNRFPNEILCHHGVFFSFASNTTLVFGVRPHDKECDTHFKVFCTIQNIENVLNERKIVYGLRLRCAVEN